MKILTFGHNGQTGHYIGELCNKYGYMFVGSSRSNGIKCDINNREQVNNIIKEVNPNIVINLAANSSIQHKYVYDFYDTMVMGNLNILQSVYESDKDIKIFVTGSGLQFKNTGQPISANDEFSPNNAYAAARIAAAYQARYYKQLGMKIYIGYLFHHESKFRNNSCISKKILNAAKDGDDVEIGDINVAKEWGFAGDIAEGILYLLNQDKIFEATIGTGVVYKISDWFNVCYTHFGRDWRSYYKSVDDYKPDFNILVSDTTIMKDIGWSCNSDLNELLRLML